MKQFFPMILFILLGVVTLSGKVGDMDNPPSPFTLKIESMLAEPTYDICVPLRMYGAENIKALQFTLNYHSSRFTLEEVILHHQSSLDDFYTQPTDNLIAFTWNSISDEGITVEDGSVLAELCFSVSAILGEELDIIEAVAGGLTVINSSNELLESTIEKGTISIVEDAIRCYEQGGDILCEDWLKNEMIEDYLDGTKGISSVIYYSDENKDCFVEIAYVSDEEGCQDDKRYVYTIEGDFIAEYIGECELSNYEEETVIWESTDAWPDCVITAVPPLVSLNISSKVYDDSQGCIEVFADNFVDIFSVSLGIRYKDNVTVTSVVSETLTIFTSANYVIDTEVEEGYSQINLTWSSAIGSHTLSTDEALFEICFETSEDGVVVTPIQIVNEFPAWEIINTNTSVVPVIVDDGLIVLNNSEFCYQDEVDLFCDGWVKSHFVNDYSSSSFDYLDLKQYVNGASECFLIFKKVVGSNSPYFVLYTSDGQYKGNYTNIEDIEEAGFYYSKTLWEQEDGLHSCILDVFVTPIYLEVDSRVVLNGSESCVGIKGANLTGIRYLTFDILYNKELLAPTDIWSSQLSDFGANNYEVDVENGRIGFAWGNDSALGVSIANNENLITICFDVNGTHGDTGEIEVEEESVVFIDHTDTEIEVEDIVNGEISIVNFADCLQVDDFDICEEDWMVNYLLQEYYYQSWSHDLVVSYIRNASGECVIAFESITSSSTTYAICDLAGNYITKGDQWEIKSEGYCLSEKEYLWSDENGYPPCVVDIISENTHLYIEDANAEIGGNICVDVKVESFEDIAGFQFGLAYTAEVLNLTNIYTNLPDFNNMSYYHFIQGNTGFITISWMHPLVVSTSLSQGETLMELCFDVTSTEAAMGIVGFSSAYIPSEAIPNNLQVHPIYIEAGQITVLANSVEECNHDFDELICQNWMKETLLENYSIAADMCGEILHYRAPDGECVIDFQEEQSCSASACENHTIYDMEGNYMETYENICDLETMGYTDKQMVWHTDEALPDCIDVIPLQDTIIINLGTVDIDAEQEACLEVTVDNFENIVGFQFGLTFDTDLFELTTITSSSLDGFTANNYGNINGVTTISWTSSDLSAGVTLDDGSVLLEICFNYIGMGQQTAAINVSNSYIIEFIDENENLPPVIFNSGQLSGNGAVNTNELEAKGLEFSIYPNPVREVMTIAFADGSQNIEHIELIATDGRRNVLQPLNSDVKTFDVRHLPVGLYMCKIQTAQGVITQVVIIQ